MQTRDLEQEAAQRSYEQTQAGTSQPTTRQDQIQVCDKIIAIFRARPSSDWRRLIAFSKQWNNLSDRCANSQSQSVNSAEFSFMPNILKAVAVGLPGFGGPCDVALCLLLVI